MKKPVRFLSSLFIILGCLTGAIAIALALFSLNRPPYLWKVPEDAASCTQSLMDAICAGDYSTAAAQLEGTPDLGLDGTFQSEVGQLLWDAYRESCSYQSVGELYATETGLAQDISFEALNLEAVLADAKERWTRLFTAQADAAEDSNALYDENGEFKNELIQQTLLEAVRQALAQSTARTHTSLTLQLVYSDSRWQVKPTGELLNAIGGGVIA